MKRRGFLGLAAGGLTVAFALPGCSLLPVLPKRPLPSAEDAMSWLRHEQGCYTLYLPRAEMGQNVLTALKQVACEELGVAWAAVQVRLPDTRTTRRVKATVGSDSIREFALPLAQACATLRDALARGQTQGLLAAEPRTVESLRSFAGRGRHVGRSVPLEQGPAIVRGAPLYAADVRLPGMVYGRVLRAPVSPELASRAKALSEDAARAVPGFVALLRDAGLRLGGSEGVGIVARTPGALVRIEAALAVEWHVEGGFEATDVDALIDVNARLAKGGLAHRLRDDAVDAQAPWDIDLLLQVPLAAHGALEPRAAVAQWLQPEGLLRLWVGSQDIFYQRDAVARQLGLDEAQVNVQACRIGGAFGARMLCTVEMEAAVLARRLGVTVKVQWSRAQELQQGFHRPPSQHRIRARLHEGRVQQWWHAFATSHILFTNAAMPRWMQTVSSFVGDAGAARNAQLPYTVPQQRTEFDLVRLPVFTGPWRGLGAGPNAFALETAWDLLADKAGADPLAFRLAHIDDPRLAVVLRQAARLGRWGHVLPVAAGKLRARGLACGIYKGMSYAATVAEVEVDAASGEWRVLGLSCVHDCGHVINPDQVRAQCEGNLVWGLAMVLSDGLPLGHSAVAAGSFAEAPMPLLSQVPPLAVELIESTLPPTGAGETGMVCAAAAIANALAAASGCRATRLPVRASDMLAAMQIQATTRR